MIKKVVLKKTKNLVRKESSAGDKLLKVGMGVRTDKDSFTAGKTAAKEALNNLGVKADLLVILASSNYNQNELIKGVVSISGKIPMVGGTTAGEISNKGFSENSIVLTALASKKIKFFPGIGKGVKGGEIKAGISLVNDIMKNVKSLKDAKTLVMFSDSMAGDGQEIIKGIQSKLGENFEIVGGALGDDAKFKETFQYFNGKVYRNSVVGFMLFGDVFTATGVRSGWESIGNRFKCTKAKGNVVYSINNTPALDFYAELLGKARSKKLPAVGLEYPFGLIDEKAKIKGKDYFLLRCPLAVDWKEKTITLAAAIPEGKEATITLATRNEVIMGSKLSAQQAKDILNKRKPVFVMMFSCVARKMVLGNRTNEEISEVRNILGNNVPITGFYTYGEIGPIDKRITNLSQTRWHNETVVLWVIAE